MNKSISMLIGAGAEVSFQISNGNTFKSDTVIGKDARELFSFLNRTNHYSLNNKPLLTSSSTGVLYQTLLELGDDRSREYLGEEGYHVFDEYRKHYNGKKSDEKNNATTAFKTMYKEFYDYICHLNDESINDIQGIIENKDKLLENAAIYSYVDSLFNYLARVELYHNEVCRVMKLYYSAHNAIYKLAEHLNSKSLNISENRIHYKNMIIEKTKELASNCKDSYYSLINDYASKHKDIHFNIITTNYTGLASECINGDNVDIYYPHGKLTLFENLHTKEIKELDQFDDLDIIFPYVLVQSGIKPVVSSYEIYEFSNSAHAILDSDTLIILGLGLCRDDEHIINLLRERDALGKDTLYLYYDASSISTIKSYGFKHFTYQQCTSNTDLQSVLENQ